MKYVMILCIGVLLGGCSAPTFVMDAPPVPITKITPEHFDLPARFAVARVVYGAPQAPGIDEQELWTDLAKRAENMGSFAPLIVDETKSWRAKRHTMIETARKQRFNYLLIIRMSPSNGSANVVLIDVGSGGVMATTLAVSGSGQNGFWGGRIRNPKRLERATLKIAQATVPAVEDLLRGAAQRQR